MLSFCSRSVYISRICWSNIVKSCVDFSTSTVFSRSSRFASSSSARRESTTSISISRLFVVILSAAPYDELSTSLGLLPAHASLVGCWSANIRLLLATPFVAPTMFYTGIDLECTSKSDYSDLMKLGWHPFIVSSFLNESTSVSLCL